MSDGDGVEIDDPELDSPLQPLMMPSPLHHMLPPSGAASPQVPVSPHVQSPHIPNSPHIPMSPHIPISPHIPQSPHVQMQYSPATHQQQQQQQQQQFSRAASSPSAGMQVRRRVAKKEEEEKPDAVRRLVRSLKTLDVYPKTAEEEILVRTGSGGLISLVSLSLIALLVLTELWAFLRPSQTHSLQVDTSAGLKLAVNFDLTFPALRCSDTSIDVMDVSGDVQVAAVRNIHRFRLDASGRHIGGAKEEYEDHAHDAEDAQREQLNPMLQALGLQLPPGGGMPGGGPDLHADQRGEGCRIVGQLQVNRVAGNIHVALGGAHAHAPHGKEDQAQEGGAAEGGDDHGHAHGGAHASSAHGSGGGGGHSHGGTAHVHQFMINDLVQYNCSHVINRLSFGADFPGAVQPLDGVTQTIPAGPHTGAFQYFVKVVPTVYESAGAPVHTNQYSVTEQAALISLADGFRGESMRVPGVFFIYDLSPFMVRVRDASVPLSTFLTSVCAIVGGVLTVAGVLDGMLFAGAKMVKSPKVTSPNAKKG